MTDLQRAVFAAVLAERPAWFRARSSGERVTLASLYRARMLERQARRGVAGAADAAYEYRVDPAVLAQIRPDESSTVATPPLPDPYPTDT